MSDDNNWGEAFYPDGSRVPLVAPPFTIPEDEREIIINRPGFVMWTRRPSDDDERGFWDSEGLAE